MLMVPIGWEMFKCFPGFQNNCLKHEYNATYRNNKSAPIPADTRPEVERFLRRIGYRLVLRELSHDAKASPGSPIRVVAVWENVGVAPPYRDDRIAVSLRDGKGGSRAIVTGRSIRGLGPGRAEFVEDIPLPEDLEPGPRELAIGIVDPGTRSPSVRPAIAGREADGWYSLSRIEVRGR